MPDDFLEAAGRPPFASTLYVSLHRDRRDVEVAEELAGLVDYVARLASRGSPSSAG
jgi:hypothetical protein